MDAHALIFQLVKGDVAVGIIGLSVQLLALAVQQDKLELISLQLPSNHDLFTCQYQLGLFGSIAVGEDHILGINRSVFCFVGDLSCKLAAARIGNCDGDIVNRLVVGHAAAAAHYFRNGVLIDARLVKGQTGEGKGIAHVLDSLYLVVALILQDKAELAVLQNTGEQIGIHQQLLEAAQNHRSGFLCLVAVDKIRGINRNAILGIGDLGHQLTGAVVGDHYGHMVLGLIVGIAVLTVTDLGDGIGGSAFHDIVNLGEGVAAAHILHSGDLAARGILQNEGEHLIFNIPAVQGLVAAKGNRNRLSLIGVLKGDGICAEDIGADVCGDIRSGLFILLDQNLGYLQLALDGLYSYGDLIDRVVIGVARLSLVYFLDHVVVGICLGIGLGGEDHIAPDAVLGFLRVNALDSKGAVGLIHLEGKLAVLQDLILGRTAGHNRQVLQDLVCLNGQLGAANLISIGKVCGDLRHLFVRIPVDYGVLHSVDLINFQLAVQIRIGYNDLKVVEGPVIGHTSNRALGLHHTEIIHASLVKGQSGKAYDCILRACGSHVDLSCELLSADGHVHPFIGYGIQLLELELEGKVHILLVGLQGLAHVHNNGGVGILDLHRTGGVSIGKQRCRAAGGDRTGQTNRSVCVESIAFRHCALNHGIGHAVGNVGDQNCLAIHDIKSDLAICYILFLAVHSHLAHIGIQTVSQGYSYGELVVCRCVILNRAIEIGYGLDNPQTAGAPDLVDKAYCLNGIIGNYTGSAHRGALQITGSLALGDLIGSAGGKIQNIDALAGLQGDSQLIAGNRCVSNSLVAHCVHMQGLVCAGQRSSGRGGQSHIKSKRNLGLGVIVHGLGQLDTLSGGIGDPAVVAHVDQLVAVLLQVGTIDGSIHQMVTHSEIAAGSIVGLVPVMLMGNGVIVHGSGRDLYRIGVDSCLHSFLAELAIVPVNARTLIGIGNMLEIIGSSLCAGGDLSNGGIVITALHIDLHIFCEVVMLVILRRLEIRVGNGILAGIRQNGLADLIVLAGMVVRILPIHTGIVRALPVPRICVQVVVSGFGINSLVALSEEFLDIQGG